jgi:hypothetical protein
MNFHTRMLATPVQELPTGPRWRSNVCFVPEDAMDPLVTRFMNEGTCYYAVNRLSTHRADP